MKRDIVDNISSCDIISVTDDGRYFSTKGNEDFLD